MAKAKLRFNAKELAALNRPARWEWLRSIPDDAEIVVVFEDGAVTTTAPETIYSIYCWGIYNLYPNTPALKHHLLTGGHLYGDSHLTLMNNVLWDCYEAYNRQLDLERLQKLIYEETNHLYNDFTAECGEYVETMDIYDFLEISGHPEIQKAITEVKPTPYNIATYVYPKARAILTDEQQLPNNRIARAIQNKQLNIGQIMQCTVVRGSAADVDSRLFPRPIMANFTLGMRTLYDSITESRGATRALTNNEDHLRKVEYFNRKTQLMASTIMRLHREDCGSTTYLPWAVHAKDLQRIEGVYYWNEKARKLQAIRLTDTHLIGQTIQLRNPLYCAHPDSQGVCAVCLGEISLSIPDYTNPGDFAARCMSEESAQTVLSTKHLDGNAMSSHLSISAFEERYINQGNDENSLVFSPRLKDKKVRIHINANEARGFGVFDFNSGIRIDLLQTSQITELSEIMFEIVHGKETERVQISVSSGSLRSSLSHEMLAYVRDHGWNLDENNNFVIDLSHWDFAQPALVVPARAQNMLDVIKSIESFLRASNSSAVSTKTGRGQGDDGEEGPVRNQTLRTITDIPTALREFYELVTSNLQMNLPHLSLILKSTMIRSSEDRDYRIPLLGNKVEFGSFDTTMERRSAGTAMAYERHHQMLTSPTSYLIKNRPDSIYDPLLR